MLHATATMSTISEQQQKFKDEALESDAQDPLRHLRDEFIFPTIADLHSKTVLDRDSRDTSSEQECLYFCGNSLGLQPKLVQERVTEHLSFWGQRGVFGHFTKANDTKLKMWTEVDDQAAEMVAPIVGADPEEVAAMDTLTGNLHLAMASFYTPTKEKHKIIIESKAFPSDHYAVESQLRQHNLSPKESLITIEPTEKNFPLLTTQQICDVITEHAATAALVLLPGIQYYTGQLFDIPTITAHAHSLNLLIGWDLAHAVGNVPLSLHDWNVDFAVWCHYKYVNAGPGAIGGLFVHEKHGHVDREALKQGNVEKAFRHRLAGWWSVHKKERFEMKTDISTSFVPRPGAWGFQMSNPCVIALAALQGSLEVFAKTDMAAVRRKSLAMTGYIERLFEYYRKSVWSDKGQDPPFWIITPKDPAARGAQLSVQIKMGLLDPILEKLEAAGVVLDERKPDVLRVAPAPLYNTFEECWRFAWMLTEICKAVTDESYKLDLSLVQPSAANGLQNDGKSAMVNGAKDKQAWSDIK